MVTKNIDSDKFKEIIYNMAKNLEVNKETVDALNVFPVPDGDTGTNMNLTVQSALNQIINKDCTDILEATRLIAKGSLLGARGNSGVILSQLFKGFSNGFEGVGIINTTVLANALKSASDTAYKAVIKPVEGTILTVARESAEKAVEICSDTEDVLSFLDVVLEKAKYSLSKTPEKLKVLKDAGVVDAGGKGFVLLLEGAYKYLKGEIIERTDFEKLKIVETENEVEKFLKEEDILFTYCTEFIINDSTINSDDFYNLIKNKGDSIICVNDDNITKVHIHTNDPGDILSQAAEYGELINVKIENMKQQFRETNSHIKDTKLKEYGFISVGTGEGIKNIFSDIGVDFIIEGGQTMNPSTEDIVKAVKKVNAENVIILPNNKNIILAAEQAAEISDKSVYVIHSRSIPEGIAAMIAFDQNLEKEQNIQNMEEAMSLIKTGEITFAVRNTKINNKEIKEGEIIAIHDVDIINHGEGIKKQTVEFIKSIMYDDHFLVTIIYGQDTSLEQAEEIVNELKDFSGDYDYEILEGGQPLYYYLISVE